jgi:hypothetical protein
MLARSKYRTELEGEAVDITAKLNCGQYVHLYCIEHVCLLLFSIEVGKSSLREAGAIAFIGELVKSDIPTMRETSIKVTTCLQFFGK